MVVFESARVVLREHAREDLGAVLEYGIGMSLEGRIRGHMFVKGAWRDSLAYAILEPESRSR